MALSVLLHVAALAALVAATLHVPAEIDRAAAVALVNVIPSPAERPHPMPDVELSIPEPRVAMPALTVAEVAPSRDAAPGSGAVGPAMAPDIRSSDRPAPIDAADISCAKRVAPVYPEQSRRMQDQGSVEIRIEFDSEGKVVDARVTSSSGHPHLDAAALEAVRQWRCEPALRDGQHVGAVALQSFEFTLQQR
jgi:protein TonB